MRAAFLTKNVQRSGLETPDIFLSKASETER